VFCFVFETYYIMLPSRCQPDFAEKSRNFHRGRALFFVHPYKGVRLHHDFPALIERIENLLLNRLFGNIRNHPGIQLQLFAVPVCQQALR
jgi:hypothetical protein